MSHSDADQIPAGRRAASLVLGILLLIGAVVGVLNREAVSEGIPRFLLHLAALACLSGGSWLAAWGISGRRR